MNARADRCWHCASPIAPDTRIEAQAGGASRAFCCGGCAAAAQWIEQLGLGDYYRLRSQPAPRAPGDTESAWRRPELLREVARPLGDGRSEALIAIEGVRCAACVWLIERALGAERGIDSVQVNAVSRRARIVWREHETSLADALAALARAGYTALPLSAPALDDARRREAREAMKRLLVAGFGAMQAMMYASALYFGAVERMDTATRTGMRWLGLLVATPVVLYSARPFFAGAWRALRARTLGMDVPVALALAAIYAASVFAALRGRGEIYFDSVSMFVFFLLAGRYLEMRARHRAGDLTDSLARLAPAQAERVRAGDGTIERVAVAELAVGDLVHVAEGGIVPVDGELESASCRVDEALLSGESQPLRKQRGDMLIAGSVLAEGPARIRARRVGMATTLAAIQRLIAQAQAERPRLARAGERAAAHFVVRVLALAALCALVWTWLDPARAFDATIAVLVVSCPCAFALAVPAAITRALGALARRAVLIVHADAIETLAAATHVVFDKTGTLTEPQLALADVEATTRLDAAEALAIAAALARQSRHPVAVAIAAASTATQLNATHVVATAGGGLAGEIDGRRYRLGRAAFALASAGDDDAIVLADDDGALARLRIGERLRAGAREAVAALRAQGLQLEILSGDAPEKVRAIAARLDIADWKARQLPADKLARLQALRADGARVIAVGDGINDAPVLAAADVAVAIAGGAELAQASSDIVLAGERLDALAEARRVACETLQVMHQNQRWAFVYNLAAVPLAALGFVPGWLAAAGMSASSLVVVLNALRIDRRRAAPVVAAGNAFASRGAA
ncbi:MAG: cadmium-translocating P-type ATPase [Proteobacteria bacterium]|uniref:heavy metal translocating P-type ATPase n=1 Tax=Rudaea sp. TaxID=2136325 RepID=UPI003783F032|nr:cadmium-translocating P-type ATPase [Pseudomonadota bacterium]